jgi:hypothetical protein
VINPAGTVVIIPKSCSDGDPASPTNVLDIVADVTVKKPTSCVATMNTVVVIAATVAIA